jgi:hypothetical protein
LCNRCNAQSAALFSCTGGAKPTCGPDGKSETVQAPASCAQQAVDFALCTFGGIFDAGGGG